MTKVSCYVLQISRELNTVKSSVADNHVKSLIQVMFQRTTPFLKIKKGEGAGL
jgi:hypothetical protein